MIEETTGKEVIKFIEDYFEEYNKQAKNEYGTEIFDELPDSDKSSISALGILLYRIKEKFKASVGDKK